MTKILLSCFNKNNSDYFLSLFLSGILFWVVNFFGLGYTYDSHLYVEIADEINSINFFLVQGFNIKPPVFPIFIFLFGEENIIWINFFSYLCIQSIGVYFSHIIKDRLIRYSFLIILIFATPHLLINSFLWTEPIFLAVMLLSFYFLERFYRTNQLKFLITAIILLSILPFIRFAGIFLIFPLLGFLILTNGIKRILIVPVLVILLLIIGWMFLFQEGFWGRWERFIHPYLTGRLIPFESNLFSYTKALSSWFFPYSIDSFFTRLTSVVIVVIVVIKSTKTYFKLKRNILFLSPLLFLIYFFLIMSVFKVEYYAAERYLSIFYLLIILNILIQIDNFIKSSESFYFKRVAYFCVFAFCIYSFLRTIKNVFFWYDLRSGSGKLEILDNALALFN